jgi:hypothetical protein
MRSLLIIVGIAVLFVCWGLFVFFTVGDKGSPPWDFGVVKDIPGESPYSTQRFVPGKSPAPSPQHVAEKPTGVGTEGKKK